MTCSPIPRGIEMAATVISRRRESWVTDLLRGDPVMLPPAIDVSLPLPDLHRRVEFGPAND